MRENKTPVIFGCVLLVLIISLHRFSYYGAQTQLVIAARAGVEEGGLDLGAEEAMAGYDRLSTALSYSPLLGGLVALAFGARWALLAGAVLLALSQFLFGFTSVGVTSAVPFVLGHGLLLPSIYAMAAELLSERGRSLRWSLFFVLYAGVNLGAFTGPAFSSPMTLIIGIPMSFVLQGVVCLVLVIAAMILAFNVEAPESGPRIDPISGQQVLALGLLAAGAAIYWYCLTASIVSVQGLFELWSQSGHQAEWVRSASVVVLIMLSLAAAIGFFLLHNAGRAAPRTATIVSLGLAVAGAGFLLQIPMAGADTPPHAVLFTADLLLAFGELALVTVLVMVASSFGSRWSALAVAVYYVAATGALFSQSAGSLGEAGLENILPMAITVLAAGGILWLLRSPISQWLGEPPGRELDPSK